MYPAATRSNASRPTGLFAVRSSFLPCLQLGAVALESLLVQIEYARIAGALATIVLARPERSNRRWVVVGGKLGHRGATQFGAIQSGKKLQRMRYPGENGENICCPTPIVRRRIDLAPPSPFKNP